MGIDGVMYAGPIADATAAIVWNKKKVHYKLFWRIIRQIILSCAFCYYNLVTYK